MFHVDVPVCIVENCTIQANAIMHGLTPIRYDMEHKGKRYHKIYGYSRLYHEAGFGTSLPYH